MESYEPIRPWDDDERNIHDYIIYTSNNTDYSDDYDLKELSREDFDEENKDIEYVNYAYEQSCNREYEGDDETEKENETPQTFTFEQELDHEINAHCDAMHAMSLRKFMYS